MKKYNHFLREISGETRPYNLLEASGIVIALVCVSYFIIRSIITFL